MRNIKNHIEAANIILAMKITISDTQRNQIALRAKEDLRKMVLLTNIETAKNVFEHKGAYLNTLVRAIERDILKEERDSKVNTIFAKGIMESFCDFLKSSVLGSKITLKSYKNWLLSELTVAQDIDFDTENAIVPEDIIALIEFMPEYAAEVLCSDLVTDNFSSDETAGIALKVLMHNLDEISQDAFRGLLSHMSFEGISDEGKFPIDPIDFIVTELGDMYEKNFLQKLIRTFDLLDVAEARSFIEEVSDEIAASNAYGDSSGVSVSPEYDDGEFSEVDYTEGLELSEEYMDDDEVVGRSTPSGDPRKRGADDGNEDGVDWHVNKVLRLLPPEGNNPTVFIGGEDDAIDGSNDLL